MLTNCLRRLTAACLFLLLAIAAQAQVGQWVYKAHMTTARNQACGALGKDGMIYVFGGSAGAAGLSSAERYDPGTDAWTPIADLPTTRIGAAAVTIPDGRILIIGGTLEGFGPTDMVTAYDPATNSYTPLANLPKAMANVGAGLGKDGHVIVLNSAVDDPLETYSYNIGTNAWSTLAPLDGPIGRPAVGADAGGTIYLFGGWDHFPQDYAYSFDEHADAWTPLPKLPTLREHPATAQGGDTRMYVVGGYDFKGTRATAEMYDADFNLWSQAPAMNALRGSPVCVADAQGRIYAIGGLFNDYPNPAFVLDSVERYEPSKLFGFGTDFTVQEGTPFSGEVAKFKHADLSLGVINFTATIDWGDGTTTAGSVAAGSKPGLYKVLGTHTYAKALGFIHQVKISSSAGEEITLAGDSGVDNAPMLVAPKTVNADATIPFSGVIGTFTDQNTLATAAEYKLVIDWGDGNAWSDGDVTTNSDGGFFMKGSHTYNSPGIYTMKMYLTDGDNFTLLSTNTAKVGNPPATVSGLTINAVEGNQFSGTVATFTHPNTSLTAGNFTASVTWGDGSVTPGNVVSDGQGGYLVKGAHTYMDEGSYPVSVSVTLTGGPTGNGSGSANVADAPLTANGFTLLIKNRAFSDTVAFFTDGNPYGTAGEFTAAIFWGDGKSSTGTVIAAGSGFKVKGSHTYAKKSKYTVTISIKDAGGSSATATTYINALNAK